MIKKPMKTNTQQSPQASHSTGASSVPVHLDMRSYFAMVNEAVCRHYRGLIVDAFAGNGHGAAAMYQCQSRHGRFVAIDYDRQNIRHMLSQTSRLGHSPFLEVASRSNLDRAFNLERIATIRGDIPDAPYGKTGIDLKGQADFVLCNEGLMSVPPEKLQATLNFLSGLLAPKAEMFIRFTQQGADITSTPLAYRHEVGAVLDGLTQNGLIVRRNPDLPDPAKRPIKWIDIRCVRPA